MVCKACEINTMREHVTQRQELTTASYYYVAPN